MRIPTWLGLAAVCVLAGCGPDNGLTMGRVSGTVTYKGEPVELGDILFSPDTGKGTKGVPSMGKIMEDGTYTMSTQEAGDGVIAGYHKVGIRVLDPNPVSKVDAPASDPTAEAGKDTMSGRINMKKAQARARRKNRAKADAPTQSFGANTYRFLIPDRLANPETSQIEVKISTGSNRVNFDIAEDGSVKVSQ